MRHAPAPAPSSAPIALERADLGGFAGDARRQEKGNGHTPRRQMTRKAESVAVFPQHLPA
ncbi:hypothetical protein JCM3263A_27220 [Thermobifida fusca]